MANEYWQLLQDPRWQKKRLEIFERDKFACVACGDTTTTLHVHHGYYEKNKKPWEYSDHTLHTLCDECHAYATEKVAEIKSSIGHLNPKHLEKLRYLIDQFVSRNLLIETFGCSPEEAEEGSKRIASGEFSR